MSTSKDKVMMKHGKQIDVLLTALSIIIMLLINVDFQLYFMIALGIGVLALHIYLMYKYRETISLKQIPAVMMLIFLLISIASYFYGNQSGLIEIIKNITMIFTGFNVLILYQAKRIEIFDIAKFLVILISIACILSIDMATMRILSAPKIFLESLTGSSDIGTYAYQLRIFTINDYPNTFAVFAYIGVLCSLYLWNQKANIWYIGCAILMTTTFIYCVSIGAVLICGLITLLVIWHYKKQGFIYLAYTIIMAFIAAVLLWRFLGEANPIALIGILFISGIAAFLFGKISSWIIAHFKWLYLVVISCFAVVYIIAGFMITTPYHINQQSEIRRNFDLNKGTYYLEFEVPNKGDMDELEAYVEQRTYKDELYLDLKEVLAQQQIKKKSNTFVIDQDSSIKLRISANGNYTIQSIKVKDINGKEVQDISLHHPLLPESIVYRASNLLKSDTGLERLAMYKDAFHIGMKSPILGHGYLSFAYESASIANFYYHTNYVHSQPFELFLALGILGVLLYYGWMIYALLCTRKQKNENAWLLSMIMITLLLHSLIDIDLSFVFASSLIIICTLLLSKDDKRIKVNIPYHFIAIPLLVLLIIIAVTKGYCYYAVDHIDDKGVLDTYETLIKWDLNEGNNYKEEIVQVYNNDEIGEENKEIIQEYANDLVDVKTLTIKQTMRDYAFKQGNKKKAWKYNEEYVSANVSDISAYEDALLYFVQYDAKYASKALDIYQAMCDGSHIFKKDAQIHPYALSQASRAYALLKEKELSKKDLNQVVFHSDLYQSYGQCHQDGQSDLSRNLELKKGEKQKLRLFALRNHYRIYVPSLHIDEEADFDLNNRILFDNKYFKIKFQKDDETAFVNVTITAKQNFTLDKLIILE